MNDTSKYIKHLSTSQNWTNKMRSEMLGGPQEKEFVNEQSNNVKVVMKSEPSDVIIQLMNAIETGNKPTVLTILSNHPKSINACNTFGRTPLILATMKQDKFNLISLFLAKKADVRQLDQTNRSALHYAVLWQNIDMLKKLTNNKLYSTIQLQPFTVKPRTNKTNNNNNNYNYDLVNSMLHFAVDYKRLTSLQFLLALDYINPNTLNNSLDSPLTSAIQLHYHEGIEAILNANKPIDIQQVNQRNFNAIQLAIYLSDFVTLDILYKHNRVKQHFNEKSKDNELPIHFAMRFRKLSVIGWLMEHKVAINVDVDKRYGYSIAHWAVFYCDYHYLDLLMTYQPQLINVKDSCGLTPLEHCILMYFMIISQNDYCPKLSENIMKIGIKLISSDADLSLIKNVDQLHKFLVDIIKYKCDANINNNNNDAVKKSKG